MEAPRVAVLGVGTMGRGIVQLLLEHCCRVTVFDPDADSVDRLRESVKRARATADALMIHEDLGAAVEQTDLVLETIPEDLEAKVAVLAAAAAAAPVTTPIASNTSSLDLGLLGDRCAAASRLLGVHWFNPPQVIPGVEVAVTPDTGPWALERVLGFLRMVGKQPVVVRSSPGYVANRLHEALLAEALRCVAEGIAHPQDVDRIVTTTFGPRFAICGPFEVMDQTGLEVQQRALENLRARFGAVFDVPDTLADLVAQARTGLSAGRGVYDYAEPAEVVMARRMTRLQAVLAAASSDSEGDQRSWKR